MIIQCSSIDFFKEKTRQKHTIQKIKLKNMRKQKKALNRK